MLPTEPMTRTERYLARLAGQDVSIPDTPITREEEYLAYIIENGGGVPAPNAGAHNAIFRGKNLGSTYTQAQADAIDAGTFDGLFVGDYWEIPWGESERLTKFRIAGFDCYYDIGSPALGKHHAIVVPDIPLATSVMYETGSTVTGYSGSYIRLTVLPAILTPLQTLFNNGLLSRGTMLTTSTTTREWHNRYIDIMSMSQVTNFIYSNTPTGERNTILPLFNLRPDLVISVTQHSPLLTEGYWYQDCPVTNAFVVMTAQGVITTRAVDVPAGVRPYFCLGKAPTP